MISPLVLAVVVPLACASDPSPVGAGGECFVASDCAPGLVCVPQRGGARACSNDLAQVVGRPPPEPGDEDAGGDAPEGGPDDAMPQDDGPVQDSNMPDTSKPDTSVADAADSG
jgi:hypothetical protein